MFVFCLSSYPPVFLSACEQLRWKVIIMCLDILRANKLIKCFCLVMVRHVQLSLDQSHSNILETAVTPEKFLVTKLLDPSL